MKRPALTNVILVRHGMAVDVGERGVSCDGDRMLSDKGKTYTRRAACGLKAIGCRPDVLISSPLRRAVETAEIIRATLGTPANVTRSDTLLPGAEPAAAVQALNTSPGSAVMMVGHMPHLSLLLSYLLGTDATLHIPLKKASACSLGIEGKAVPGEASLQWLLPPAVLRALGGAKVCE